jgi:hypothetical protein
MIHSFMSLLYQWGRGCWSWWSSRSKILCETETVQNIDHPKGGADHFEVAVYKECIGGPFTVAAGEYQSASGVATIQEGFIVHCNRDSLGGLTLNGLHSSISSPGGSSGSLVSIQSPSRRA